MRLIEARSCAVYGGKTHRRQRQAPGLRIVDDAQHIDTPAADDQRIAIAR